MREGGRGDCGSSYCTVATPTVRVRGHPAALLLHNATAARTGLSYGALQCSVPGHPRSKVICYSPSVEQHRSD